jgi:predicted HicB family RNase H-like nuclease
MTPKPARSVRVSQKLWQQAKAKAKSEGKTVSEIIIDSLKEYVK